MKEYWKRLTPAQKEARLEKQRKGARDAKKRAYAADAPARAARAAEKQARAALPRTYDGVEVVPPEPGSTRRFVGVSWHAARPGGALWKAEYKYGQGKRDVRFLGHYPTNELAARTRYDHIIDKGLERFNKMDVPDGATGLMVPRERKKPPKKKKRPPPPEASVVVDGSKSRSGRPSKAIKR